MRKRSCVLTIVLHGLNLFFGSSSHVGFGEASSNSAKEFADDFFEGPEKTLMLKFNASHLVHGSLRNVPDTSWRDVMQQMGIAILSQVNCGGQTVSKSNLVEDGGCTAYLLSESSLFVYHDRVIFKTCGLSSPLRGLRLFLDVARGTATSAEGGLEQVLYSHPAFLRQDEQRSPHRSWEDERSFLHHLFPTGVEKRLGTPEHGTDVFAATFAGGASSPWVVAEIYITELEQPKASYTFDKRSKVKPSAFWKANHPDKIDEFYFDPSGYSANVLHGNSYNTLHASPQLGVSYLSHATNAVMSPDELKSMVDKTIRLAPGKHVGLFLFSFSASVLPTLPMNTSFAGDGYSQYKHSGTWVAEGPNFRTSLLSLTHHGPSSEMACMVDGQQHDRCADI